MPSTSSQSAAWESENLANPHAVADKARRVQAMFGAIAPSYDLNNRLHSLGQDQAWRRAAVRIAQVRPGDVVLDVACGTGDLSLAFARTQASRVVGIDFTCNMLSVAQQKRDPAGHSTPGYAAGDAMRLPVADASVDVVSIAFGIRNVAMPTAAMAEFARVLKPGGRLVVLEFSLPTRPLLLKLYMFYFNHIMPRTATLIARDRSGAYKYLPRSVSTFLQRQQMIDMMNQAGLRDVTHKALTCGIAVVYRGVRG